MPAPFFRQLLPDLTPHARVVRHIDNHYHLEMVAENSRQLVEYHAQSLRLHHEAAIANIRGMGEIAHRQDKTNSLLSALVGGMDQLSDSMDTLNTTARETRDAVYAQTQVLQEGFEDIAVVLQEGFEDIAVILQEGFEDIATRMMEQQRVLQEITNILRRPYETKALELLKEADRALKNGMQTSDRDQQEEFKDAARLLGGVLENPIGSRNYIAWFQAGWLNWKFKGNPAEAEEAFYQAARLSGPKADLYHAYSLRHLAYMQYLQGRCAEAYDNMHKALHITPTITTPCTTQPAMLPKRGARVKHCNCWTNALTFNRRPS
jgi:tetratricopeptide (TPR) repeat protein